MFFWRKTKENDKGQIEVKTITTFVKDKDRFANGAIVHVKNGKGLLRDTFTGYIEDENSYYSLMLGDKTLFQLQGEEYYCPTCEKIVKTGYNLEQTEEFFFDAINSQDASFEEVVKQMEPLLGLLEDGHYCLWDTELYPTDGNGRLFWDYPNDNELKPSSCMYYLGDGDWGSLQPHFTIATQPFEKCDTQRVEYYRKHPGARAIAYYMDGNLTALIDGHHKAMAAALDHRSFKAIVISKASISLSYNSKKKDRYLRVNDATFHDLKLYCGAPKKMPVDKEADHARQKNAMMGVKADSNINDIYPARELASFYPVASECASADNLGNIDDVFKYGSLNLEMAGKSDKVRIYINALAVFAPDRFLKAADYILHNSIDSDAMNMTVDSFKRWYDRGKAMGLDPDREIKEKLGKDSLQDYFIAYMTEIESEYPIVGKHVFEVL